MTRSTFEGGSGYKRIGNTERKRTNSERRNIGVKKKGMVISLDLYKNFKDREKNKTIPLTNGTLGEWGEKVLKIRNSNIEESQNILLEEDLNVYDFKKEMEIISFGSHSEIKNLFKKRKNEIKEKQSEGKKLTNYDLKMLKMIKLFI